MTSFSQSHFHLESWCWKACQECAQLKIYVKRLMLLDLSFEVKKRLVNLNFKLDMLEVAMKALSSPKTYNDVHDVWDTLNELHDLLTEEIFFLLFQLASKPCLI